MVIEGFKASLHLSESLFVTTLILLPDVILADDEANFSMELRNEIDARRKPEKEGGVTRSVMIFFENSKTLLDFYKCEHMQDIKSKTRTITEDIASSDKDGAFLQASVSGSITLMIREFGRGI